jgi:hypothetical protein
MKTQFLTDIAKQRCFDPSRLGAQFLESAMRKVFTLRVERRNGDLVIRIPDDIARSQDIGAGQRVDLLAFKGFISIDAQAAEWRAFEENLKKFDRALFGDDDWESWRPEDIARRGL